MFFAVDRMEGAFAVCVGDDRKQYDLPLQTIPFPVQVRDILVGEITPDGVKIVGKDDAERERRLQRVHDLRQRLMNR